MIFFNRLTPLLFFSGNYITCNQKFNCKIVYIVLFWCDICPKAEGDISNLYSYFSQYRHFFMAVSSY